MRDGSQRIFQCAQCGTVVVQTGRHDLGPCPSCQATTWWRQRLPLAGLHESALARYELDDDGEPTEVWPRITTVHPTSGLL
jgi:hypothetical protein